MLSIQPGDVIYQGGSGPIFDRVRVSYVEDAYPRVRVSYVEDASPRVRVSYVEDASPT